MFLELYGFLIHWFLLRIEDIKPADTTPNLRKKFINTTGGGFDWHQHKVHAFEIGCLLFDLKLTKIWTLTPERNTVVSLFTKPAYQLFENPANTKSKQLKDPVFRLLGLCIKHHEHSSGKNAI
jgi:condensin complex subunit 1